LGLEDRAVGRMSPNQRVRMQRGGFERAGVRPRRGRSGGGRPGRASGLAPAAKGEHRAEDAAAAVGAHRVRLGLGVPLYRAGVRAACQELAGECGGMEIEDVPHVLQTEQA